MENDSAIFSLPLQVWQQVLASSYNCLVALGIRSLKQYEQLFLPFCGLKSTSKHFQGQLDDEFFFRTIKKYCLSKYHPLPTDFRITRLIIIKLKLFLPRKHRICLRTQKNSAPNQV